MVFAIGDGSPLFYWNIMMDQHIIEHHLAEILAGKDIFLVSVKVDNNNKIVVHIDKHEGINIDDCVRVSKELENKLDRDREDFVLEVSSPGLNSPFRVIEQYHKYVGRTISVVKKDGDKLEGILKEVDENGIVFEMKQALIELPFIEIKSARASIQF